MRCPNKLGARVKPTAQMSPAAPTANPRLVVTAHDPSGTAIFASDAPIDLFYPMGPQGSSFAVFDRRGAVPVNNVDRAEPSGSTIPRCPPRGAIFCITNIAPGFTVPMHRTLSLDWAVVLSGEIVLRLEGGAEKTVRAGEFIVQGGVNHQWVNETAEVCRIAVASLDADKVTLADGTELDEVAVKRPA